MKKTIFAVMLALVLTFTLCALPAFADETEPADGLLIAPAPTSEAIEPTEEAPLDVAAPGSVAIEGDIDGVVEENIDTNAVDSIDAAVDSIDLEAAIESVDADDLMENGVNDITGQDALIEENTSWLNGTSGIIAIIVAAIILVAAIIAIIALAPKKSKQK